MKICLHFTLFLMIKQISITLILSLLMCVQAFSQDKLASLPEQQRDSVLVEIAQNLLKEKYPKRKISEMVSGKCQSGSNERNIYRYRKIKTYA